MITGTPRTVDVDGVTINTPFNFGRDYLSQIYVIMDSITTAAEACKETDPVNGTVTCDLDGDGTIDLLGGGDRSWLDLDGGGGGASSLTNWIHYGFPGTLSMHTWVGGQDGVAASVFDAVYDYQRLHVVLVPVFNAVCAGDPASNASCTNLAHASFPLEPGETDTIVYSGGTSMSYFHIIGFAPFFISCIESGSHKNCPGHQAAVSIGKIKNNTKTIEGYFVTNYPVSGVSGPGGADVGINVVSLTR
jgi:hypothetical protein